jgi:hypothetical protein
LGPHNPRGDQQKHPYCPFPAGQGIPRYVSFVIAARNGAISGRRTASGGGIKCNQFVWFMPDFTVHYCPQDVYEMAQTNEPRCVDIHVGVGKSVQAEQALAQSLGSCISSAPGEKHKFSA